MMMTNISSIRVKQFCFQMNGNATVKCVSCKFIIATMRLTGIKVRFTSGKKALTDAK